MKYFPGGITAMVNGSGNTSGGEYMYSNCVEYIGPWYNIDGEIYPGKLDSIQISNMPEPLVPYNGDIIFKSYAIAKNKVPIEAGTPHLYYPTPTKTDYDKGYFYRFFCRKRNNNTTPIIEISESQYKTLQYGSADLDLNIYKGIQLKWIIVGSPVDIMHGTIVKVHSVYHYNKITVLTANKTFPGIQLILNNYIQFARMTK